MAASPNDRVSPSGNLKLALDSWSVLLGHERVLDSQEAEAAYLPNTIGAKRKIRAAIRPQTTDEVAASVKIAADNGVPLYPVSTGRNWGYGAALPVRDNCVVVDLSTMIRIIDLDVDLGLVTVEPGVTQEMMHNHLVSKGLPFLVPVTGAGPDCSLLGNALERGYGITPYADHFGAVTSLTAVLANGTIYRPALSRLGGPSVDRAFKWGIGPYLDGLFSQSGLGIVTEMTIALAPKPDRIEAFMCSVSDREQLEVAVLAIRTALRSIGGVAGSINLMNDRRMLSMFADYPKDMVGSDGVLPREVIDGLLKEGSLGSWTIGGVLYGDSGVVKAARHQVKAAMKPLRGKLRFFTRRKIEKVRDLLRLLPIASARKMASRLNDLAESFKAVEGAPTQIPLNLCYWKSGRRWDQSQLGESVRDPARDGCGLIWYSPLVEMKPKRIRQYVDLVEKTCIEYGIEPLITLTSLSARCFDSTVPLLFDPVDEEQKINARKCYLALFERGRQEGFLPYRVGVDHMKLLAGTDSIEDSLANRIKKTLDSKGIISPGRYPS